MLATLITRVLQLIFAVIVLGLSIHAAQWQKTDSIPSITAFNAFAGAFAVLVTLIGITAIWLSAIPSLITAGIDGLASILLFAGGVAYAVKIAKVDCKEDKPSVHNPSLSPLLNGGCIKLNNKPLCAFDDYKELEGRCQVVQADTAFLLLAFVACVGAAVLCFLAHKRGRSV